MRPAQPDHADIMRQLEQNQRQLEAGARRFSQIDEKLTILLDRVTPIPEIQADLATAKADIAETKELVEAWTALKTFGRFFKWAGGVLAGFLAVVAIVRAAAKGFL